MTKTKQELMWLFDETHIESLSHQADHETASDPADDEAADAQLRKWKINAKHKLAKENLTKQAIRGVLDTILQPL